MAKTAEKEPALFAEDSASEQPKTAPKKPATTKPKGEVAKVEQLPAPDLLRALVAAATDPNCQPEKMHALLDARERIMLEQAKVGYRRAYREVKAKLPVIDKDGRIDEGTTRSGRQGKKARFATFENLMTVVEPKLRDAGLDLSLQSEPRPGADGILMRATLSYIAQTQYGEIVYGESSVVPMPPDPTGSKNPAQAVSSALAYAKRNAIVLVLAIVSKDPKDRDVDGNDPEKAKPPADHKVGADAIAKLDAAIKDCGVPLDTVLKKFRIKCLEDLKETDLNDAIEACAKYKVEKSKRGIG